MIQENQGDAATVRALVENLQSEGHIVHLIRLEKGADAPVPFGLPGDAPLVCHGPGFVTRALHHPRLSRGLFFDPAAFRWSAFRAAWGDAMLARDGNVMTLAGALERLRGQPAFVRPDADSKAFDGAVLDREGLLRAALSINHATSVVLARPMAIEAEWRFFIVAREVAACSEYRRWGRPSVDGAVPHAAIELAAELAMRWSPAEVYCLDLAAAENRVGVIEANCFNASRFYAADMRRILQAVNAHVLARHARAGS